MDNPLELCWRVKLGLCVWKSEKVSQRIVYMTNNTPVCGAHGWEQSTLLNFFLYISCGRVFFSEGLFSTAGHLKGSTECSGAQCWRNERDGGLCSEAVQAKRCTETWAERHTAAAALMSCGLQLAGASEAGTWFHLAPHWPSVDYTFKCGLHSTASKT